MKSGWQSILAALARLVCRHDWQPFDDERDWCPKCAETRGVVANGGKKVLASEQVSADKQDESQVASRSRQPVTMKPRTKFIGNEGAQEDLVIQSFGNASQDLHGTNGWVLLAPYGNWPNADGLQKFERSDAEAVVGSFHSLVNTAARFIGLPWYVGHPDHPAFAQRFKDTSAKGRIKQLEVREDGLWANVKWN